MAKPSNNPDGRPASLVGGRKVHCYLDAEAIAAAQEMGGPKRNVSAGIRAALKEVQALRQVRAALTPNA